MTKTEFSLLLDKLADAWKRRDYSTAAHCFAAQVRYGDPLRYSFQDIDSLRSFFEADDGQEQRVEWHTVLFDELDHVGAVEYTYSGSHNYHGVAIVRVEGGVITHWREHQHIDDRSWLEFAGATVFQ
jgi:SnoaL-like domain